ncbi:MAG: hypothetical protein PHD15_06105 [Clostridia bacterium]|nr:hypothetical protein [Clostridia bacterium]
MKAVRKSNNKESIVVIINKMGRPRTKPAVLDHRNGNNSLKSNSARR